MTKDELPPKPPKLLRHIQNTLTLKRLNEKARIVREREEAQVKKAVKIIQEKPTEPVNGETTNVLWALHDKKIDDLKLILFEFEERLIALEERLARKNGQ